MSRNYDNWERLVAAVIKREQIWELCHQPSRTPSICSEASSSDFSSSFRLSDAVKLENNQESAAQKPIPKIVLLEGSFKNIRPLGLGRFGASVLIQLRRGVRISDQEFLAEGTQIVGKILLGEVKETEEEFKKLFGNCRHENVATPMAYYFSNNNKYIFNDYHRQGSIYDLLHGKRNSHPNWESRLKIAIGAARGIAFIHGQYGGNWAHGNVKSSNIFVNSEQYGCVSDFGLAGIMKSPGKQLVSAEYEYRYKIKNPSHESDVCSFGVVLFELLTGKSAPTDPEADFWIRNLDIDEWALSVRPEDWCERLFDQSLWRSRLSYQSKSGILCDELDMFNFERDLALEGKIKAEMIEMFQVARRCLAMLPEERPMMFEVVLLLENIASFNTKNTEFCDGQLRRAHEPMQIAKGKKQQWSSSNR